MSVNINPYSLYEVVVARTNAAADAYEAPIQLYKDQIFRITPVHDTATQRDSGAITSGLSIPTHGEGVIQAGGIPYLASIMMTGASSSTSNSIVTIQSETGVNRPYFGAIGGAYTEDGRFITAGLYKCQIQNDPGINFDGTTNDWMTQELNIIAFAKEDVRRFWRVKIYESLAAWVADKPTDGTEMLAWFA